MDRDTAAGLAGLAAFAASLAAWLGCRVRWLRRSMDELRGRVERVEARNGEPTITVEVRGVLPDRGVSAPRVEPAKIEPPPSSRRIDRA